jgi:hypothetical protein
MASASQRHKAEIQGLASDGSTIGKVAGLGKITSPSLGWIHEFSGCFKEGYELYISSGLSGSPPVGALNPMVATFGATGDGTGIWEPSEAVGEFIANKAGGPGVVLTDLGGGRMLVASTGSLFELKLNAWKYVQPDGVDGNDTGADIVLAEYQPHVGANW